MDCRILRQVTLKSDGHLGCDDSVGYGIDLGRVAPGGGWRLRDVLNGPVYSHVREVFRDGRVPWPGTCEGCDLLADGRAAEDTLDRHIDLLVEPTLACTLGCACCLRKSILRKGRTEDAMDPEVLRQFVGACVREGIALGEVNSIGWVACAAIIAPSCTDRAGAMTLPDVPGEGACIDLPDSFELRRVSRGETRSGG